LYRLKKITTDVVFGHTGVVWCVIWHCDVLGMWVIGWANVVHVITAGFGFYVVGILYAVVGIRVFVICLVFGEVVFLQCYF